MFDPLLSHGDLLLVALDPAGLARGEGTQRLQLDPQRVDLPGQLAPPDGVIPEERLELLHLPLIGGRGQLVDVDVTITLLVLSLELPRLQVSQLVLERGGVGSLVGAFS